MAKSSGGTQRGLSHLLVLCLLAMGLVFTITGAAAPNPARATVSPVLFYTRVTAPNAVNKVEGGTNFNGWFTAPGSNDGEAIAANDTYLYWSHDALVYRRALAAGTGAETTEFFSLTTLYGNSVPQQNVKFLVIDAPFLYVLADRGGATTVFRVDLATGVRDSSWTYTTGGNPCSGLAADSSPTGSLYVNCGFGSQISRLSKAATAGAPTTVVSAWLSGGTHELPNGNGFIQSLVADGTYLYWRTTNGTVRRTTMQATSTGSSETVVAALPSPMTIAGMTIYNGVLYLGGTVPGPPDSAVFSAVPNATTPPTPTRLATLTSGGMRNLTATVIAVPAATPTITSQPTGASVTEGDPVSFSVAATTSDAGTLSYQWRKDGVNIAGATASAYSIASAALADAGAYTVVVTNTLGASTASATSSTAQLAVAPAVAATPTITSQPTGASVTVGDPASFSVAATRSDSGTLSYQWRKDGMNLAGATASAYSIASAQLGDAGAYTVVVTNTLGSSTASASSSTAQLAVSSPVSSTVPVTSTVPVASPSPLIDLPVTTTTTSPPTTTGPPTTTVAPDPTSADTPELVTSENQEQLTSAAGTGNALVDGVPVEVEIVRIDVPAADKAPEERTPEDVQQLQVAASGLIAELNALLPEGATPPAVVTNTDTGAVIDGLVRGVPVPVEEVTVVNAADSAVLVAGVDSSGTRIAPNGESNGPEIDEGGQVAALAYGLTPGAPGEFVVMSSPTLLGSFVVGADGTFNQQAFLPAGLAPGRHTLVVATPRLIVGFGFTITAATATPIAAVEAPAALPATGSTGLPTTALWVWLLISGGVSLVLLSRRRRHSSMA